MIASVAISFICGIGMSATPATVALTVTLPGGLQMNLRRTGTVWEADPPVAPMPPAWKGDEVDVNTGAPPAMMLVITADGRRAGVRPGTTVDQDGSGQEISEIYPQEPSAVDQGNLGSYHATSWFVRVPDEPPHVYTIQLRGTSVDPTRFQEPGALDVSLLLHDVPGSDGDVSTRTRFLIVPGELKEFRVTTDRNSRTLSVLRVVQPAELVQSVAMGCTLGLMSPDGVCQSLEAKARAAEKALARGRTRAALAAVQAFLNELKAQGGKHVQEPTLTILREEAEALLNPPPPMPSARAKAKPKAKK